MYYWKVGNKVSRRYFSTASAALEDISTLPVSEIRKSTLIHIPESQDRAFRRMPVKYKDNSVKVDFTLFPQERNPEDNNEHEIGWLPAKQYIQWGKL